MGCERARARGGGRGIVCEWNGQHAPGCRSSARLLLLLLKCALKGFEEGRRERGVGRIDREDGEAVDRGVAIDHANEHTGTAGDRVQLARRWHRDCDRRPRLVRHRLLSRCRKVPAPPPFPLARHVTSVVVRGAATRRPNMRVYIMYQPRRLRVDLRPHLHVRCALTPNTFEFGRHKSESLRHLCLAVRASVGDEPKAVQPRHLGLTLPPPRPSAPRAHHIAAPAFHPLRDNTHTFGTGTARQHVCDSRRPPPIE